jgi:hypothetical protein
MIASSQQSHGGSRTPIRGVSACRSDSRDGVAALYGTTDAAPDALGIAASANGSGAQLTSVKGWPMKPAEFDLSRFQV